MQVLVQLASWGQVARRRHRGRRAAGAGGEQGLWVAGLLFYPSAGTHAAPYLGWRVS